MLSNLKFALCTPGFMLNGQLVLPNKPWLLLISLYERAVLRSSFKWFEVVYFRMLDMKFLAERLETGKTKSQLATEFMELQEPVFDRRFVFDRPPTLIRKERMMALASMSSW